MNENELTPAEHADVRARLISGAARITPVGRHRHTWIAGSIAVALVAVIAGGVGIGATLSAPPVMSTPSPTPTPSLTEPAPTPTPTPSASVARVVAQPENRFAFDCDDLAVDAAGLFDGQTPPTLSTIPLPHGNALKPGPMQYAFAQAGGVYCEFGDYAAAWGALAIVPDADGVIAHLESVLGPCETAVSCEVIDGTYISVTAWRRGVEPGPETDALLAQWYDTVRARVQASPPKPAAWHPPTGSRTVTGECSAVLTADRLGAIYGADIESGSVGWGGWSVEAWMLLEHWQTDACAFYSPGGDAVGGPSFGSVTWLPGGEWAYDRAAPSANLTVPGAQGTDRAAWSCVEGTCAVDVLADGNWVRVALAETPEADRPRVAAGVAAAVIATVRG